MSAETVRQAVPLLPLFVPATRPDRFARACASGADAVIVDLEDAVAEDRKADARSGLAQILHDFPARVPILVRINAQATSHFERDLALVAEAGIAGLVLPKAESADAIERVRAALPGGSAVVALVETARGVAEARGLAAVADRLAFGSIDYAEDLGLEHCPEALLTARSEIVLAARLAHAPPPVDGVTPGIDADAPVERDARYAQSLGFGGKLLVHPAQIIPAVRGFAPDPDDVDHARELLARAEAGAARFHGKMVDRPVVEAARRRVEAFDRAEQRLAAIRAGVQAPPAGPPRSDGV